MLLMHANNREDIKEARAGDIVALAGLKNTTTGDTLCDPDNPVDPRAHGLPRSGHRDRDRAEDQGRPGEDGRRRCSRLAQEDPTFRVSTDQETRPDHHQGHGRAASRDHRRPPAARATRSTPTSARRRSPIARRITARSRDRLHPQEADRRFGPVRPRQDRASSRGEPGSGFEFENKVVGGSVPKEFIPGVEKGLEALARDRRARRLPGDRLQGDADRRQLPRRRLRACWPSKSPPARRSAKASPRRGPSCSSRS